MAREAGKVGELGRRISRGVSFGFSYKKITIAVCFLNLLAALFVLRAIYTSSPSSDPNAPNRPVPFSAVKYTEDQIRTIEEAIRLRRAAEPVALVNLVKKLRKGLSRQKKRWELSNSVKVEMANEILKNIRGLNETEQREAVELWRVEKLEEIRRKISANLTSGSDIPYQEAQMLKKALKFDWLRLLEGIGFWMPAKVSNTEIEDKPENAPELEEEEEEIIPGRPMPPECHAETHTDYDGVAVRWGLTHYKETAADCCQACLDQAKNARPGEKRCNIWVYCPSEYGCFSPDIYEHKHQECWLKQADKPRLNFKNRYSEAYRNSHPTAPAVVPWMSGVVGA